MVCVEVDNLECVPDGMVAKTIPRSKYAVFSHDFELTPDHISIKQLEDNIFRYVYREWFAYSNYEPTGSYTLELYHTDRVSEGFTTVEVYIPIKASRK
jgi:predicted transcriptional regulator YdeE